MSTNDRAAVARENLRQENAKLRRQLDALRAEIESLAPSQPGPALTIFTRQAIRLVAGDRFLGRGVVIGTFVPHAQVTADEAETAIRAHKAEFAEA